MPRRGLLFWKESCLSVINPLDLPVLGVRHRRTAPLHTTVGKGPLGFLIDITEGKCDNRKCETGKEAKAIAYKIVTEKCATVPWLCGDCRPGCPNQAIGTAHTIDPNRCTECVGAYETPHCAEICPAGACVPDTAHRETRKQLLKKWRRLHPGEEPTPGTY